jgi:RimJ/RimL family protein N-acetyltransferase
VNRREFSPALRCETSALFDANRLPMDGQPTFTTSGLVLRPFHVEDIPRVAELANDEQLSINLRSFGFPYTVEDASQWIQTLGKEWASGQSTVFAVCVRDTEDTRESTLVGAIGIVLDRQSNRGELGYWIGRSYWGQGIATEAGNSMLDFAFGQLCLNKLTAECLTRNPASSRVLEKLGMVQEGFFAKHFRKHEGDDYCDVQAFGLLRTAWNERK